MRSQTAPTIQRAPLLDGNYKPKVSCSHDAPDGWVGSILLEASDPILAILREDALNRSAGYNGLVLAP
jgi:hypothetical protein